MSTTDMVPAYLARVQGLYPGAVGVGTVTGIGLHRVKAEVAKLEKRGEIAPVWRFAKENRRTGQITIPYVRLKERSAVRRTLAVRVSVFGISALMFLTAVCWLVWESRMVIMAAAGMAAAVVILFWLAPHWSRGCAGLHCAGCRG